MEEKFISYEELSETMYRGNEVVFEYSGISYGIFPMYCQEENAINGFIIGRSYEDDETWYNTMDELGTYEICGKQLKDIITEVDIKERNF